MEWESIVGIVAAVFITTVVSGQYQRRALDKKLKKDDLKAIFASMGLKNFRADDFNKLTEQGMKNLAQFIMVWKQSSNPFGIQGVPGMAGFDPQAAMKAAGLGDFLGMGTDASGAQK